MRLNLNLINQMKENQS